MVYKFTIDGRPMTKKNSMTKTRYGIIQSKQYRDYEKMAMCQLMTQKPRSFRTIACAARMNVEYYMPNRKGWPDLFGLVQATADILEKAGIVEDDGYIADVAYSCIAGVDPFWPRAEIKVIPMPDNKLNELHPKIRKKSKNDYRFKGEKTMAKEMTKYELIDEIAEKACCTKLDARNMLNAFIDTVTEQLVQGNKVKLIGFGTFEVRDRKGREGRNPRTNEPIQIEASRTPAFKVGKQLKDLVNGK